MTQIPFHFLALFADLHVGDELILHKGVGAANWKIELFACVPRGGALPLPQGVWQSVLSLLSEDWQGNIRFYCCETSNGSYGERSPWLAKVKTCPPVDLKQGMVTVVAH